MCTSHMYMYTCIICLFSRQGRTDPNPHARGHETKQATASKPHGAELVLWHLNLHFAAIVGKPHDLVCLRLVARCLEFLNGSTGSEPGIISMVGIHERGLVAQTPREESKLNYRGSFSALSFTNWLWYRRSGGWEGSSSASWQLPCTERLLSVETLAFDRCPLFERQRSACHAAS